MKRLAIVPILLLTAIVPAALALGAGKAETAK